ncbi:hypothetical protein A2U01_0064204, partial [Trifolium medium]|nr:hypothetical protein [Trifolium medium]
SVVVVEMNGKGAPKQLVKVFAAPPNIALQWRQYQVEVK